MGVISKDNRKLTLYYNSDTSIGNQTYGYANASEKKLLAIDISKTNVTGTQWTELAKGLNKQVIDLLDTEHPDFVAKFGEQVPRMKQYDWLKILENEPQFLRYPIAIFGDKYLQIESAAAFKQHLEPDSAGLEKQPLNKQFTDDYTP